MARPSDTTALVLRALVDGYRRERLPGRSLLLAVSGGADSVALLVGSAQVAPQLGLRLEVATLDHGLRPEAAAETRAVVALAQRLGLPAHVRALGLAPGPGLEERARAAREAALEALRRERGLDAIATGHTASEQAETLLMRLVRGSALQGARGIHAARGHLVRPLLGLPRASLRAFLAEHGVGFHEDPMNADPRFLRARVRHAVLPALEAAAGFDPTPALARFSALAAEDAALLEQLAGGAWERLRAADGSLDAVGVRALPSSLRRRVLARLLHEAGLPPDFALVERMARAVAQGGATPLPGGLQLRAAGGRVRCVPRAASAALSRGAPPRELALGGALWLPETGWRVGEGAPPGGALRLGLHPRVAWPLTVRTRLPGDRVPRAAGSRKLQDLLVDARVPRERRDLLPVVTDAGGRLLWVPGVWSDGDSHAQAHTFAHAPRPGAPLLWAQPPGAREEGPL